MVDCRRFETCEANMCPMDELVHRRTWIIGEDVCELREYRTLPWIRRQRVLNKRPPAGLVEEALSFEYLVETAPKKRVLSEEQRARLVEMGAKYRYGKNLSDGIDSAPLSDDEKDETMDDKGEISEDDFPGATDEDEEENTGE